MTITMAEYKAPTIECSSSHLEACTTSSDCESAGGVFTNNSCIEKNESVTDTSSNTSTSQTKKSN